MILRLWPFILGSVGLGLDAYVVAGLLPAMSRDLGTSEAFLGLGVTAFTGAYAVVGPLLAGLAGRRSRRSLALALAVFTLANLGTMVAPGPAIFIVTRLVAGAAAGIYSPLSSAVAASLVGPERRGQALSLVLAGLALGTVFGVPLGLMVADVAGWRLSIGLIAVLGVVALVGVALRGNSGIPNVPASTARERLRTLTHPRNLVTTLVTLTTGIAALGLYTYITHALSGTALAEHHTLAIWIWGLGGAIGALTIGRVVDAARSPLKLSAIILSILALAFGAVALGSPLPLLAVGLFAWGAMGWSSLAPQQHTLISANPDDGATAVAANASANYLGAAIGSALGAALIGMGLGGSALALCAGATALVALTLQLIRLRMSGGAPHDTRMGS